MAIRAATILAVALFTENLAQRMGNCISGTDWSAADVLWIADFSEGKLDERTWDLELADAWQYGFNQFGNFEQQWYSKDAVRVAGGTLKITAEYHQDPVVVEQLCWDECYQRCLVAGKELGTADFEGCMNGCGNTGQRCKNLGERGITSGRLFTKKAVCIWNRPTTARPPQLTRSLPRASRSFFLAPGRASAERRLPGDPGRGTCQNAGSRVRALGRCVALAAETESFRCTR